LPGSFLSQNANYRVWSIECSDYHVLIIFMFASFGGAAVLFLLAFLTATIKELPLKRAHRRETHAKKSLTLVLLRGDRDRPRDHNRTKDRAA